MHKLPLEPNLTSQQRIHISVFIFIGIYMIYELLSYGLNTKGHLILLAAILGTSFFVILFFSKKGLAEKSGVTYNAVYLGDFLILKKKIDFNDKTACSVLKFKKSQKYPFFSAAKPDLAHEFNAFDIYLLNQRHTKKTKLFSLKKESNSKLAIDFLTNHTELKHEIYSPNFS